jgi:hypothetical protein
MLCSAHRLMACAGLALLAAGLGGCPAVQPVNMTGSWMVYESGEEKGNPHLWTFDDAGNVTFTTDFWFFPLEGTYTVDGRKVFIEAMGTLQVTYEAEMTVLFRGDRFAGVLTEYDSHLGKDAKHHGENAVVSEMCLLGIRDGTGPQHNTSLR